jgi:hypothetical protein
MESSDFLLIILWKGMPIRGIIREKPDYPAGRISGKDKESLKFPRVILQKGMPFDGIIRGKFRLFPDYPRKIFVFFKSISDKSNKKRKYFQA